MNAPIEVPSEFLNIRQQEGISLESEGSCDLAFTPEVALRAIRALTGSQTGILGGEVWRLNDDGRFVQTYDIWDVERSDYKRADEFLQQSWDLAERQVNRYINLKDKFFIVLNF